MCKNVENMTEVDATEHERQDIKRQYIKTNTNNAIQDRINNNQEGDNTKKNERKIEKRIPKQEEKSRKEH